MQLTLLHGYPDFVGKRATWCGYGNGPSSLLAAGDLVKLPCFGYYIDAIAGSFRSVSGIYDVIAQPAAVGARASWSLIWRFATTGSVASVAQNQAGTGMTTGTYIVTATTGTAQISVVVASATTLGAITVLNPGSGYTLAPTFTLAAGGTSATLTATLSTIGATVAAGANLSAEQVQIMGFGGQY
jgi:hypothetical protein